MKEIKKIGLVFFMVVLVVLTGCTGNVSENNHSEVEKSMDYAVNASSINPEEMFSTKDKEIGYDANSCIAIKLSDNQTQSDSGNVKVVDNTVTITDEGTYLLTGSLSNGQIIVDSEKTDKVRLVFEGVEIANASSAPIYVKQGDKVFITLGNDSKNKLSTSGEFVTVDENNIDAVIFSKEDLTLNGNGSLEITSPSGNGITAKDDLVITSGTYLISGSGHGLEGKDSVRIANGEITINSGKDGIHSENTEDSTCGFVYIADGNINITAQTDGISGTSLVQTDGGNYTIKTGGGSENASTTSQGEIRPEWGQWEETEGTTDTTDTTPSAKGVKSDTGINVNGGGFSIDSSDDSIHSNGDVFVNNGSLKISSGDDGIHGNSNVTVKEGTINIEKSYEGIEGQSIDILGGTVNLTASDDGLNAAGGNDSSGTSGRPGQGDFAADENAYINISGGKMSIDASGDGVDSNGNLVVTGGETYVSGPSNTGNGALDYNGTADISGGIFMATDSGGMTQNFSETSTQGTMLVATEGSQTSEIILKDDSGNVILSFTPKKAYSSVVMSTPEIQVGKTYTVETGDATQMITMDSLIYGNSGGMGGPGNMREPGGQRPENF